MRFLLYCMDDARDLGIEAQDGSWDYERFRQHIEDCPACIRFRELLGGELLNSLDRAFRQKKSGQVNDRPLNLNAPPRAERLEL